jgi:hypothetical protein
MISTGFNASMMVMAFTRWRSFFLMLMLMLAGLWACPDDASAHADGRVNIRVVHFTYHPAGMTAYFRLSLPQVGRSATGAVAPYIVARRESGRMFYYASEAILGADPMVAAAQLAAGHLVAVQGKAVAPVVLSAAIHVKGAVPPFSNADQARQAVRAAPLSRSPVAPDTEIDNVLLDAAVLYPAVGREVPFEFSSVLSAGDLSDAPVNTILVSHAEGATTQYSHSGYLGQAITVNPPALQAIWQFIRAGAAHILEGFDHLLLVICLVVVDLRLRAIAMKITAFSAGHAVSIVAGFYGLLPGASWVAPVIELLIALSVLGAALLIIGKHDKVNSAMLTCVVGAVHGFGLALGLRRILSDTGPNIVTSLVSFNVGVEFGQLIIGAGIWLLFRMAQAAPWPKVGRLRLAVALAASGISLLWIGDRTLPVWDAIRAAYA